MKTYGVIAEYNPFHNGHVRHLEMTRGHGATHIAAVMSGDFVQRGDAAVADKFKRAQTAVKNGVDLVLELPVAYSAAAAELFARAGVALLGALGVDAISFGSESGDGSLLQKAAYAAADIAAGDKIKPLLDAGMRFPAALRKIAAEEYGIDTASVFDSPNNILAVEYLKAIRALGLNMEAVAFKREGAAHDGTETVGRIASASYIRKMIERGGDISAFVPVHTLNAVTEYANSGRLAFLKNLEQAALYRLRTVTPREIAETPDVGQGLQNRLFEAGRNARTLEEFFELVNTKRYTEAKTRRILLNLLIGIKKSDLTPPPCGRILALNEKGAQILKKAGDTFPFKNSPKDLLRLNNPDIDRFVGLSARAADIYALALQNAAPCGRDFTAKIKMTKG